MATFADLAGDQTVISRAEAVRSAVAAASNEIESTRRLPPALLDKLHACRFKVDFGLDTGSEIMAQRMVKSPQPAAYLRKAREIVKHANSIDLFHDTYVLFNFPGIRSSARRSRCRGG